MSVHENPKAMKKSGSMTYHRTPKQKIKREATILEEMGFGSLTDSSKKLERKHTKKNSICISDFWSVHGKEKFLKEKGLWQTYKELKKQEKLQEVNRKKVKHASLPKIIDIYTVQKVKNEIKHFDKLGQTTQGLALNLNSLSKSPSKNDYQLTTRVSRINSVVSECESLAKEITRFRKLNKDFRRSLENKTKVSRRKKVSNQDLRQIKITMNAIQ